MVNPNRDKKLFDRYMALHTRIVTLNFELRAVECEVAIVFKQMRRAGELDSHSVNADLGEIAHVAQRTKKLAWDETTKTCDALKKKRVAR